MDQRTLNETFVNGVLISRLDEIDVKGGNILKFIDCKNLCFSGFGEVYVSFIKFNFIKGWKKHLITPLNIIVPLGEIRFVIYDDRKGSKTNGNFKELTLSRRDHSLLTIPPLVWVAFKGLSKEEAMLINLINLKHDPKEAENKPLDTFKYNWS